MLYRLSNINTFEEVVVPHSAHNLGKPVSHGPIGIPIKADYNKIITGLDSLQNIKIAPHTLQDVKGSQLFKQHFDGKPSKLDFHEGGSHNGHTLRDHVSKGNLEKDIKFLVDRRVKDDLKVSSMYPSKEVAEKVTNEVLLHNEKKIANWFNSPKRKIGDCRPFSKGFDFNIGYGIKKGVNEVNLFNRGYVVLQKTKDGMKIRTSYPGEL